MHGFEHIMQRCSIRISSLFYARASKRHSCYLGLRTVDFQDDFATMSNTDVPCLNILLFSRDIVLTLAQKSLSSKNASLQHLYLMYRRWHWLRLSAIESPLIDFKT